jgi:xanthine dehydrogenase accessory factor
MISIELYERVLELSSDGRPFILAAVIDAVGSTPQKAGANAVFEPVGRVWGTLGGGCLEAESRQRALRALDDGIPDVFDLKLDEVTGWDDGLICGGRVRVFVNPAAESNADVYREALAAAGRQESGVLATVIAHPSHPSGQAFWVTEADLLSAGDTKGLFAGQLEDVLGCIRREKAGRILKNGRTTENGDSENFEVEVYLEPVVPAPKLLIGGGGHIGQAVCRLANKLGFEVTVIDDRPAFANPECHPNAKKTICGDIAKELGALDIRPNTYVLIVTRGHRHDGKVLASCIHSDARYIGMIGSRRKSLLIRKTLVEEGVATRADVERVVSPIGLDIGAESVEEIAVSIVAQLVAVRRNANLDGLAKNFLPSGLKP